MILSVNTKICVCVREEGWGKQVTEIGPTLKEDLFQESTNKKTFPCQILFNKVGKSVILHRQFPSKEKCVGLSMRRRPTVTLLFVAQKNGRNFLRYFKILTSDQTLLKVV